MIEFKHESNFIKSQFFFNKKNWDSTLVYSMKQLSSNNNHCCPIKHLKSFSSLCLIELTEYLFVLACFLLLL